MDAAGHGIPPPLGPSRPFRLMARVDPVMCDAGCDRRYFFFAWGLVIALFSYHRDLRPKIYVRRRSLYTNAYGPSASVLVVGAR